MGPGHCPLPLHYWSTVEAEDMAEDADLSLCLSLKEAVGSAWLSISPSSSSRLVAARCSQVEGWSIQ